MEVVPARRLGGNRLRAPRFQLSKAPKQRHIGWRPADVRRSESEYFRGGAVKAGDRELGRYDDNRNIDRIEDVDQIAGG
jgi:hypothetical protein